MHGRRDRDRLALAARERGDRLADRADRGDGERLQRLGRALLHHRLLEPLEAGRAPRGRGTCSGRRRGCRTARGPGRRPRSRAWPRPSGPWMRHRLAVEEDLAVVVAVDPGDALDQRRLAGAVVADERHHLAGSHLEVDVGERLDGAEALRQVADLEQRCGGGRRVAVMAILVVGRRVGGRLRDGRPPTRWLVAYARLDAVLRVLADADVALLQELVGEEAPEVRLRDRDHRDDVASASGFGRSVWSSSSSASCP